MTELVIVFLMSLEKIDKAVSLSGSNSYINIPNSASLNIIGNKLTVAAWVKADSNQSNSLPTLISKDDRSLGRAWTIWPTSEHNEVRVWTSDGVFGIITIDTINDGNWHHVAMVYDGSYLKYYIDGILNKSMVATGNIVSTSAPVRIGSCYDTSDSTRYLKGLVDEVFIGKRALSALEVGLLAGGITYPFKSDNTTNFFPFLM